MPLSNEQNIKVLNWLSAKKVSALCPSCGQNKWAIGQLVAAPEVAYGGFLMGGPITPMVQLICGNCAYIRLYAAVPMGITGDEAPVPPAQRQPKP